MSRLRAAAVGLALSAAAAAAEETAPRRLAVVAIPDLRATLQRVEQVGAVVAPGTLAPGALAAWLGQRLGDPGLAGLGQGPLVILLASGASPAAPPSVAVFVPVSSPEPYEKAMTGRGWTIRRAPGLLMGGSAPLREDDYRQIAQEGLAADLRISLSAVDVMDAYGPILRSGVDMMAASAAARAATDPAPSATANVLQLEARAFLLLLDQTASVVVDVALQPDAVATDTVITARPGTALAEVAAQAPAGRNAAAAFLTRPAAMTAVYQLDGARLSAFAEGLLRGAAAAPPAPTAATSELPAFIALAGRAFTGEAAQGLRAGTSTPLVTETVLKVRDEPAALALMEKAAALFAPGGAWHGLLAELAVPARVALQKSVRRHGGVRVHRFQMTPERSALAALPSERRASLAVFLRDTEFAIVRGYLMASQDPAALDALVDRAASSRLPPAPPLQAAQAFGEGAQAYVDYDVFAVMRAVMDALPAEAGKENPFAALPAMGPEPTLYAAWLSEERIRLRSQLPLRPFAALLEAVRKAGEAEKAKR